MKHLKNDRSFPVDLSMKTTIDNASIVLQTMMNRYIPPLNNGK